MRARVVGVRLHVLYCAVGSIAALAAVAACGPATAAEPSPSPPSASVSVAAASPLPTRSPSQAPAPTAAPPATAAVTFTGLRAGTYPLHVHSVCSGSQQFHITVLPSLVVRNGAGVTEVPAGYLGRGLCLIVYTSPAATQVLATRRI